MEAHNASNSDWSHKRMERLEKLYRDGISFSLIAADIGVTRSACIGKARRMNLPKRVEITESKPNSRRAKKPQRQRALPMELDRPVIIPDHDYSCGINDLTDCSCRYPLWHTSAPHLERLYCGVPGACISAGVPYCARHAAICGSPRPN